jgi:drug/metabolite transporter (DMT)-like permease
MRVLPTPYHGIVDYSVGAMLVVSPWVVDFDKVTSIGVWIAVLGGAALMISSAVTDYEGSILARWLTMPQHLLLDGLLALGLIATPFVFGFADEGTYAWLPFVAAGVIELVSSLITQTTSLQAIALHRAERALEAHARAYNRRSRLGDVRSRRA